MKDKAYLTGLLLITITFIACVISFWLLVYGVFIFGIGVLFIWVSKKSVWTKVFATILPVIFYLPATYLFLLAYNYTPPKTFLIPSDYQGTLRIVYDKCGMTPRKANGRQILEFPENGILILNQKFDGGINNDYYLVDKNGNRTKVTQIIDFKDRTKQLPSIQVGSAGKLGITDSAAAFSDFYLYNKDTTINDDDESKVSQDFDSLTMEILKLCRSKK